MLYMTIFRPLENKPFSGADAGGGLGGTCPGPLDPAKTKKIVDPIPLQLLNFYIFCYNRVFGMTN